MSNYFEYIEQNSRTLIDDNTARYIKTRSLKASSLAIYVLDDSASHALTGRQEQNLMYLIPNEIRIKKLLVMKLPLLSGENLISLYSDLHDEYIGYSIRYPVVGTNIAYVYIYVGRGASTTDIGTIRQHLTINIYGREIYTGGNVGLQIFNANGEMIFNSNNNIMSVKYFYNNPDIIGNNVGTGIYFYNNCTTWNKIPDIGIIYNPTSAESVCINKLPGGIIWGGNYSGGGATFCISGYITFTSYGVSVMFGIGQMNMIYTQYELAVWTDWLKGNEMPDWTKTYNSQFGKSLCVSIVR